MKINFRIFAALVSALAFIFLLSASPPTLAAEKPEIEKFSGEKTKTVSAGFVKIFHENKSGDVSAYSFTALRNHALKAGAGITHKNSVGLAINPRIGFSRKNSSYESPPTDFEIFTGFDNPARGKI